MQPQVGEDLADHRTLQDRRDDLHLPAVAPPAPAASRGAPARRGTGSGAAAVGAPAPPAAA
jgi:hypothetical protein